MMNDFQTAVRQWVISTFGKDVADDVPTRCFRFFEESSELCQSLGMTKEDAHKLVDYVWGRPVGDPPQEAGGAMVTLCAMLSAPDVAIELNSAAWKELVRCWEKQEKIRAKQKSKAAIGLGASPIPGCADLGRFVTLRNAVDLTVAGFGWMPQGSHWRIVGENGVCWEVEAQRIPLDPNSAALPAGIFAIQKDLFTQPRTDL